ncbi:MAG: TerC family protein [Caldilineales bacterium]|nr:TerC family protein [Caldilineales bacterium]
MSALLQPDAWIALITLTALEIVLGIDNIIFISILSSKLPVEQQARSRQVGLLMAMGTRILLLFSLAWIIRLQHPLFTVLGHEISGRDLILFGGGLFLLAKSTYEIHDKLEGVEHPRRVAQVARFGQVVAQIMLLDIVFSLDSVITAVGMANQLWVMVTAVVIAVFIMLVAVNPISAFVDRHPTVKMLALSFLLLIGFTLVADGLGLHIPKGYIYFAMAFSVMVEMFNIRLRRLEVEPVHLRSPRPAPVVPSPAPAPTVEPSRRAASRRANKRRKGW